MAQSRWMLVALEGQYRGRRFGIPDLGLRFGREADNNLILDDEKISRRHAVVTEQNGVLVLEDLKSRNGSFVNGQRINRVELKVGDKIALGNSLFEVNPAEETTDPLPVVSEATLVSPPKPLARTQAISVGPAAASPGAFNLAAPNLASAGESLPPRSTAPSPVSATGTAAPVVRPSGVESSPEPCPDPDIFNEATGILTPDKRRELEQRELEMRASAKRIFDEPTGMLPGVTSKEPIFGGAASGMGSNLAHPLSLSEPPIGAAMMQGAIPAMPSDLGGSPVLPASSGSKRGLLYGGAALALVILLIALVAGKSGSDSSGSSPASVSTGVEAPPVASEGKGLASVLDGKAVNANPAAQLLTPEEQALPKAEREARAVEHVELGESQLASSRLKEARDEFDKALALDPACQVCLIRLTKVRSMIKQDVERYRNEALRASAAMDFSAAKRSWERVRELETDPDAVRQAEQGILQARQQLQQQPNR
ncbi:MAG: FHA domain-containing protein [Myxococcota bacterium]